MNLEVFVIVISIAFILVSIINLFKEHEITQLKHKKHLTYEMGYVDGVNDTDMPNLPEYISDLKLSVSVTFDVPNEDTYRFVQNLLRREKRRGKDFDTRYSPTIKKMYVVRIT